jgi:hypothetical protein
MAQAKGSIVVAAIGDLHCGSRSGLTPPGKAYRIDPDDDDQSHWAKWQDAMWTWFAAVAKSRKVTGVILNGDLVDGRGPWTGGIEEITTERRKQAKMAARCAQEFGAEWHVITSGTPAHVSKDGEDWDASVAEYLPHATAIGTQRVIDPGKRGVLFHLKHHVSSSVIPHGRWTGPAREALWTELNALHQGHPQAQVVLRSHAHYAIDGGNRHWRVFVLPCLQGETLYPRGHNLRDVDIGVTFFEITGKGNWAWQQEWLDLPRAGRGVLVP